MLLWSTLPGCQNAPPRVGIRRDVQNNKGNRPPTRRRRERANNCKQTRTGPSFRCPSFDTASYLAVPPRQSSRACSPAPIECAAFGAAIRCRPPGTSLSPCASDSALVPSRPSHCAYLTTERNTVNIKAPPLRQLGGGLASGPLYRSHPWILGTSQLSGRLGLRGELGPWKPRRNHLR